MGSFPLVPRGEIPRRHTRLTVLRELAVELLPEVREVDQNLPRPHPQRRGDGVDSSPGREVSPEEAHRQVVRLASAGPSASCLDGPYPGNVVSVRKALAALTY